MRALKLGIVRRTEVETGVTTQAHEGIETSSHSPVLIYLLVTTQAHEGIETSLHSASAECAFGSIQCLSPAKKHKLYKSSINKSIHFVQRSLSSSTRVQRVTAQINLSRE